MENVIKVDDLRKTYGETVAVEKVSFEVERGEIFGIIGPNGAGKTTALECVMGLRQPDSGTIRILGLDPQKGGVQIRQRIGVQLQEAVLPELLKVWEAVDLFASFYEHTIDGEMLLEKWGLSEKRNTRFRNLSGGQKQRLFITLALLNDPEIVFLDELTSGLDPQARRKTWDMVRAVRERGKTVVLVTHHMDEAQELCDRVAIIDHGRIVALDSPAALIDTVDAESRIQFTSNNSLDQDRLEALPEVSRISRERNKVSVYGRGALLVRVVTTLAEQDIIPRDLRFEQASLEDVFLALTGREIRV